MTWRSTAAVAMALAATTAAAGCGGDTILASSDGTADAASDETPHGDAPVDGPEIEGDGGFDDDGRDDVGGPLSCPGTLPGEGPVHLAVRWRHVVPWAWASPGTAGFGVVDGVILAVQPSSPWVSGSEPFDVWVDAETGEALPYLPGRVLPGACRRRP